MTHSPPAPSQADATVATGRIPFRFDGAGGCVQGLGPARPLPRGDAGTLAARIAGAMAGAGPDEIIGGALPFHREADDCLWQCRARKSAHIAVTPRPLDLRGSSLRPEPEAPDYALAVARALQIMAQEAGADHALEKIVLARTLLVESAAPIAIDALMSRLGADSSVTAFQVALPQLPGADHPRTLCGATPELLVEKTGARVASHPLAGSARRSGDPRIDRQAADGLEHSAKDQREHALVVEAILDTLAPYCRQLGCPQGTRLTSTSSMWHLGTRIEGELRDPATPSVLLASALHPTPAVCGVPSHRAAGFIKVLEPVPRDFYAGAVGWCDNRGDGAWYVAIRCAEISGGQARLYAGAGIVPGSDPMAEAAETGAKFGALLAALGLPADAGLAKVARPDSRRECKESH
ncbi:isochorismate synthase [Paracoccus halophilus]|uniref:isochorismate synthase n=1 Tax=Paracoccus halophilus TaxID=376733 RepID=A0A099F3R8_9RHOB|nr:isochorismate synthase [Paracoccus halophilus]KGJ05360.1 isochorismate synthase [Paracoccus halophilus]SFA48859.1 isochorismate synthase [Paracoccus halophilus]